MVISVEDSGIGIPPDQLADINLRLGRPPVVDPAVPGTWGCTWSGLAQRHGIRVQLRERPYGGISANVITPPRLVRADAGAAPRTARRPVTSPTPSAPAAPSVPATPPTPAAPPQPVAEAPATPPAPRFAPADPSMLPQRTPSPAHRPGLEQRQQVCRDLPGQDPRPRRRPVRPGLHAGHVRRLLGLCAVPHDLDERHAAAATAHIVQVLGAASQHQQIADRFANGFNDPRDFFTWFMDPARSASYLETVAGARV